MPHQLLRAQQPPVFERDANVQGGAHLHPALVEDRQRQEGRHQLTGCVCVHQGQHMLRATIMVVLRTSESFWPLVNLFLSFLSY